MRHAAAIGLAGLVFVGFPTSARSDNANAIAGGATSAVVMGIVCAAIASIPGPSAADDDYARRGWLVGIGGSYAIETFEDDAESFFQSVFGSTASFSVDDSLGINGGAGYRCHRYLGAEIEVESISGFEGDLSVPGLGVATVDAEPLVVTANAKGYYPFGRFHPFLLAGAGAMTADFKSSGDIVALGIRPSASDADFTFRFGGGIDIYATKHIVVSVGVDYVFPLGDLEDLDYVSIGWGLQYRF